MNWQVIFPTFTTLNNLITQLQQDTNTKRLFLLIIYFLSKHFHMGTHAMKKKSKKT
jgi:hypothetical protein